MTYRTLFGALGAAAVIGMTATAPAAAADPATIRIGSFVPPKAAYMRDITLPWLRTVEKASGGTLQFKEFWGGALIRSPRKQYEGMVNGIQDATVVLPSYTQKLFPDFSLFSLPFMFPGAGAEVAAYTAWKMHEQDLLGGLGKMHAVAIYANDNSGMHFNRKLKTIDDVKGLKLRVAGPEEADVVKLLGGVPVGMSIAQVAESLNRGVIQGTLNGWSALGTFRITPLIKTHVDIPLGVRTFILAINKKVFDALPAKAKAAIDDNGGLALSRRFGAYYGNDGTNLRKSGPKQGRNVVSPSAAEMAGLAKRFRHFHDDWIKAHKDGAKKYAAAKSFIAAFQAGK